MGFQEKFQVALAEVRECEGVALVGCDGIMVDSLNKREDLDFELLVAEYSSILQSANSHSPGFNLGSPAEITIVSEESIILMRSISNEYFVFMLLASTGNFGKARFVLKKLTSQLEEEL